jgi:hypothetical protein
MHDDFMEGFEMSSMNKALSFDKREAISGESG